MSERRRLSIGTVAAVARHGDSGAEVELADRVLGRSASGRDRHDVGGQAEVFEDTVALAELGERNGSSRCVQQGTDRATQAAEMMFIGPRFVLLFAASCRQPAESRVTPAAPPSDARVDASVAVGALRASLVVEKPVVARIQDVRAVVTLTNQSATPWPLRTEFLTAGSLSLEVRELPSGKHLSSGPPPMPPAPDRPGTFRTLAAGEAMTFTCDPAIAIDHAPGRFEIRFHGVPADPKNQDVATSWVPFTVGP